MVGTNLILIIGMITTTISNFYLSLRNVPFADTGYSIFDLYIAIWLFELMVWFIIRFITGLNFDSSPDFESEGAKYQQYGETAYTSADSEEFRNTLADEEILHE